VSVSIDRRGKKRARGTRAGRKVKAREAAAREAAREAAAKAAAEAAERKAKRNLQQQQRKKKCNGKPTILADSHADKPAVDSVPATQADSRPAIKAAVRTQLYQKKNNKRKKSRASRKLDALDFPAFMKRMDEKDQRFIRIFERATQSYRSSRGRIERLNQQQRVIEESQTTILDQAAKILALEKQNTSLQEEVKLWQEKQQASLEEVARLLKEKESAADQLKHLSTELASQAERKSISCAPATPTSTQSRISSVDSAEIKSRPAIDQYFLQSSSDLSAGADVSQLRKRVVELEAIVKKLTFRASGSISLITGEPVIESFERYASRADPRLVWCDGWNDKSVEEEYSKFYISRVKQICYESFYLYQIRRFRHTWQVSEEIFSQIRRDKQAFSGQYRAWSCAVKATRDQLSRFQSKLDQLCKGRLQMTTTPSDTPIDEAGIQEALKHAVMFAWYNADSDDSDDEAKAYLPQLSQDLSGHLQLGNRR